MTAPKESPREALPEPLKVVAVIRDRGLQRLAEGSAHCVHAYAKVIDEEDAPLVRLADALSALESERQSHAAEVERLRKDAARYRWIKADEGAHFRFIQVNFAGYLFDQKIDAAIDQAIAKEKP